MAIKRTEKVLVLYASQLGHCKRAATAFLEEIGTHLSPQSIKELTSPQDEDNDNDIDNDIIEIIVEPTLMTLDDFLKDRQAAWTRLVVIFVSSYNGDSPKGGYRFRALCEMLKSPVGIDPTMLSGMHYAMCGLGSSSYTTYFENPTILNQGLEAAGAMRVGELGEADMQQRGDNSQRNVIKRWKQGIWKVLAEILIQEPLPSARLLEIQGATCALKY